MKIITGIVLFTLIVTNSFAQRSKTDSLKYKIGQMLMIGFRGTELNDTNHIVSDIKDLNIGGVVLYEYDAPLKSRPRNISSKEQLKKLTQQLQSLSPIPLFIGIDEEGGKVTRLKTKYGFKPTVSAQYLGKINNADTTTLYAKQIALACKSVGINMNFAPVVDVNTNPNCPVIGKIERSFSEHTNTVVYHANIVLHEHEKQHIFCTLKHFPGHGSSQNDSHLGFTDVTNSWSKNELLPYKQILSGNSYPFVMTSHVFNRNIDSLYPATLSKTTLNILINEIGYKGLIVSDDMMMLAISKNYGLRKALKQSINAGVDVLIFSNNINHYNSHIAKQAINIIANLVTNNEIPMQRINKAYNKISSIKKAAQ